MSENDSLSDGGLGFYLGVYGALGAANSVSFITCNSLSVQDTTVAVLSIRIDMSSH